MSLTLDQAKRIIAIAPKDSHYYNEALRVLTKAGYYGTPAPQTGRDETDPNRS